MSTEWSQIPVFHRAAAQGWRAALVLAALGAAQLACGSGRAPDTAPDPNTVAADGVVAVDARITGFSLSAGSAAAGAVTFNVENADVLPHDFTITGEGIDEHTQQLSPGDTASLTLDLPAGEYTFFCSVEGHQDAGMTGTFVVQ